MATPSKLDILRAAGKVQRELAQEIVAAEVHPEPQRSHVTTGRHAAPHSAAVNPLEQISDAQEELHGVSAQLLSEQDLLRRLRHGANATDTETEFEEFADAEDGAAGTRSRFEDHRPEDQDHQDLPGDQDQQDLPVVQMSAIQPPSLRTGLPRSLELLFQQPLPRSLLLP